MDAFRASAVVLTLAAILGAAPTFRAWHKQGEGSVAWYAAGSRSPQEMAFSLEGKISEHSPGKLTVSTEENIVFHVTYGDKTSIKLQDGSQGSAKDLRTGVKIKVDGDLAESGEIAAKTIEVEGESSSKAH